MKFETINRKFTEKVAEYMARGYIINTSTLGGHQGEIAKVDLTNGTEIVRILLNSVSACDAKNNDYHHFEIVRLLVGRVTDRAIPNSPNQWNTIWNDNLDTLHVEDFFEIGHQQRNGDKWYGTRAEAVAQQNKQRERRRATWEASGEPLSEAAKEIVLPFVRRQPRCKSVKCSEIESITKHHIESRTGKRYVKYTIKVRGQVFDLH